MDTAGTWAIESDIKMESIKRERTRPRTSRSTPILAEGTTTAITVTAENMAIRAITKRNTPMAIEPATSPLFVVTRPSLKGNKALRTLLLAQYFRSLTSTEANMAGGVRDGTLDHGIGFPRKRRHHHLWPGAVSFAVSYDDYSQEKYWCARKCRMLPSPPRPNLNFSVSGQNSCE